MIEPHIPFYKLNGSVVVREWTEPFEDRMGNRAILTHVDYLDKKRKPHTAVIRVKWVE